ncbi:MAG: nickel-dependent lactate racemase [Candidatus Ranarchaeia archaeon]
MKNIRLPYGRSYVSVMVPDDTCIVQTKKFPKIAEPTTHIRETLKQAIEEEGLDFSGSPKKTVTVVVSDHSRPIPNEPVLRALFHFLKDCSNTILIGCGLHAPPSQNEITAILGCFANGPYPIICHDAYNSRLSDLGLLSTGTPLLINSVADQADILITVGRVAPHFFAGFSGGPKAVLPGVSGKETILANHRYENIAHANATLGKTLGNPVYSEICEAAEKADVKLAVNLVLDSSRRVAGVFAGKSRSSHRKSTEFLKQYSGIKKPRQSDIVVTTNNGYPLDRSLYQAVKGLYTASLFSRKQGSIIMVAECVDGVGHDIFRRMVSNRRPNEILDALAADTEVTVDQWQAQILAGILCDYNVIMVTRNISSTTLACMNMGHAKTVQEALASVKFRGASILVLPEGPEVLPLT